MFVIFQSNISVAVEDDKRLYVSLIGLRYLTDILQIKVHDILFTIDLINIYVIFVFENVNLNVVVYTYCC